MTLTDPFLDNPPHNAATDLCTSFADSSMAFLMSPTRISATPTMPPHVYLKHSSVRIVRTPFASSPPLPPGSDPDALLTKCTGLHAEVRALKLQVSELEEKMEAGVDTTNAQLLFMASTMDHSLEQLAQKNKNKNKGKKAVWVRGGKPAVLTDEVMIDALEHEEAQKLVMEAQKERKKVAAAKKKLKVNELNVLKKLRKEAWETAKLDNEMVLMSWEATKLEACRISSGVPPKQPLALQKYD